MRKDKDLVLQLPLHRVQTSKGVFTKFSCRAGRGLLKWSLRDLAKASGVSTMTINALERDLHPFRRATAEKIIAAFAVHRVETFDDGGGAHQLYG